MNLPIIITQVKTFVAALGGRVSGAADFAAGLETTVNMPLPAAYVLRLADEAAPNDLQPGLNQIVIEHMGVVVEFDNTLNGDADRRTGFSGSNQADDMRDLLFAALLNWVPPDLADRARQGFSYGGAHMLDFDRARLFWQFDFDIETLITDADGFPLRGDPFTQIKGTINSLDPEIVFEVNATVP